MKLPYKKIDRSLWVLGAILFGLIIACVFQYIDKDTYAETDPAIQNVTTDFFVSIHDRGQKLIIKTAASTVQEVLERANIAVDDSDIVEPSRDVVIDADNYQINIYRVRPVIIQDGGISKYIMTASYDPKTIATEAGFNIYDGDKISLAPNRDFLSTSATTVYKITRNGGQTVTVETAIPFSEEKTKDYELSAGQTKLVQMGEDGRKVTKYKVNFVNGVEVSRELVSEEIIVQPIPRIVAEGAKKSVPPEWGTCANYARSAGVSESQIYIALTLIYRESGCRFDAQNASSGAYGIPQALPGSKMASAGADWQTNPVTQIRWMIGYVNGRYGGWEQALRWWESHGWY